MTIREDIRQAQLDAMKARDTARLGTVRLILAAIKNRDIEVRPAGVPVDDDAHVIDVLRRMAKQRRESIAVYAAAGRSDQAAAEAAELRVIEGFLPPAMDEAEARATIAALIAEAGATGPGDMGAVMALVKARLGGKLDMGLASRLVKAALAP